MMRNDNMTAAEMAHTGRELCDACDGGNPMHPRLQADIKTAMFVALNSPAFRAAMYRQLGAAVIAGERPL